MFSRKDMDMDRHGSQRPLNFFILLPVRVFRSRASNLKVHYCCLKLIVPLDKVHASKVIVRMLLLKYISLLLTIISPLHTQFYVYAEENNEATTSDEQTKKETEKQPEVDDGFDYNNTDWGTFYDPKNIFCGDYDCYKILGLDYFELLDTKISDDLLRTVTKRYRKLSRKWHPDKNKSKGAKERFVVSIRVFVCLFHFYNTSFCTPQYIEN